MSALSLAFQRAMDRRVGPHSEGAAIEGTPHTKTYLIFCVAFILLRTHVTMRRTYSAPKNTNEVSK